MNCVEPVKRGYGDNLIWARMNIYEDNNFDTVYDHPPTLTIKDHVHVGVEVRYFILDGDILTI